MSRGGLFAAACASVVAAVAAMTLVAAPQPARAQSATTERLLPAVQTAGISDTFSTDLTVENVSHLGAYEAVVDYDSSIVTFVSAVNGPFIASSGRTVFCPPAVITPIGVTLRRLRYGCATSGVAPPGPSGSGLLATITWTAVGPGDATLALTPSLADELGADVPASAVGAVVHVVSGPTATATATNTPCTGVCPTDTPTPTPTSTSTATATPTATSTPVSPCGASATTMCVAPANATVARYTPFDVGIAAENVTGLAAFQFTLTYDPAILTAVGAVPGPFLTSTGRVVQCLGPAFGAATVQLTCVTLADAPAPSSGSGVIALVTFVGQAEGSSNLALSSAQMTGLFGSSIVATVVGGARTIGPCAGPCPTATPTSTATVAATSTNTSTPTATATACAPPCATSTATATPTPTLTPMPTNTPGPAAPLSLRIGPVTQDVFAGGSMAVDVVADGAADLGAYEVGLRWDPSLLTLLSMQNGGLLGSSGRTVSCPSSSSGVGAARLACVTLGASPPGANGSGVLARFNFAAVAPGTSVLALSPSVVIGRFGALLAVSQITGGSVNVLPCAGPCPTATATPAGGTPTATATPSGGVTIIGTAPQAVAANVGDTVSVDVAITNANGVGAYEALLNYAFDDAGGFEPNVLEFVDITDRGFLGSSGRPVTCLPPIVDVVSVRSGCVTGGIAPPGPFGAGLLATVRFHVLKQSLRPMVISVDGGVGGPTDINGVPQPFASGGSTTVTITSPLGAVSGAPLIAANARVDPAEGGGGPRSSGQLLDVISDVQFLGLLGAVIVGGVALRWRRRRYAGRLAAGALIIGCAFVVLPSQQRAAVATNPVQLSAVPSSVNAFEGGPPVQVEVRIAAMPAPGLRSFELQASFNDALVTVAPVEGGFLGSNGGTTSCAADYPSASQVHYACTVTGSSGASGSGTLVAFDIAPRASVDLRASTANARLTSIDIANVVLTDAGSATTSFASVPAPIVAVRALEGDVNHDCVVNVADDEQIASRYFRDQTMAGYDAALDLEPPQGDGDIDLADVQFVLGRGGSRCDAPVPPQLPPAATGGTVADSDGDGCADSKEVGANRVSGGQRDPSNPYDFYDVPVPALRLNSAGVRDHAIGVTTDVMAVMAYSGKISTSPDYTADRDGDGVPDGLQYDRSLSTTPGQPWRSGAPDGGIGVTTDVMAMMAQSGHICI